MSVYSKIAMNIYKVLNSCSNVRENAKNRIFSQ